MGFCWLLLLDKFVRPFIHIRIHRKPNMIQIIRKLCDDNTNGTLNVKRHQWTANSNRHCNDNHNHAFVHWDAFKAISFLHNFAFIYSLKLWLCTPTSVLMFPCFFSFRGGKVEFLPFFFCFLFVEFFFFKISNLNDFSYSFCFCFIIPNTGYTFDHGLWYVWETASMRNVHLNIVSVSLAKSLVFGKR